MQISASASVLPFNPADHAPRGNQGGTDVMIAGFWALTVVAAIAYGFMVRDIARELRDR